MAKKARVYDGTAWQELASAQTDLTAYSTTAQINSLLSGSIKKVVSTTKTDTFSMTSTTFADVTGLSATITPTSATSKILVMFNVGIGVQLGGNSGQMRLTRGGTAIAVGDAAGSRNRTFMSGVGSNFASYKTTEYAGNFLDSPTTTSAITYSIQVVSEVSGQPVYVNRSYTDSDAIYYGRGISTITLMEVLA